MTRTRGHASRSVARSMCYIGEQLIGTQSRRRTDLLQERAARRVRTVHEVAYRGLRDPDLQCKRSLRRLGPLQVFRQGFHMAGDTIGFPYNLSIGSSYSRFAENSGMVKKQQRSFLDRAMEALKERYPRERPTQVRLAKIVGVSQPAVFEWSLPDRAPAHSGVLRLAEELNVCVEWLYTERGPKRPSEVANPDEILSPILEVWPNLDQATKRQIARYTDFIRDDDKK